MVPLDKLVSLELLLGIRDGVTPRIYYIWQLLAVLTPPVLLHVPADIDELFYLVVEQMVVGVHFAGTGA